MGETTTLRVRLARSDELVAADVRHVVRCAVTMLTTLAMREPALFHSDP